MHCNTEFFSHLSPIKPIQNELICLVLAEFPPTTDLDLTKSLIQEDFQFVNKMHVRNNSEIQCYFDCMTDLIELDQGRKYGAVKAFIRSCDKSPSICHREKDFQKPHGVFSTSSQTFDSETINILPSYNYIPSIKNILGDNQSIDPRLLHHSRRQRLTSLEDQIEVLEHLREELDLFKNEIDWDKTGVTELVQEESADESVLKSAVQKSPKINTEKDRQEKDGEDFAEQRETEIQVLRKATGNQMVISLIEGVALTGILIGGLKLFKTFIG